MLDEFRCVHTRSDRDVYVWTPIYLSKGYTLNQLLFPVPDITYMGYFVAADRFD